VLRGFAFIFLGCVNVVVAGARRLPAAARNPRIPKSDWGAGIVLVFGLTLIGLGLVSIVLALVT
jgi:hypothetical protein